MANNVQITPGTGDVVAAEDISLVKYQKIKLVDSAAGSSDAIGTAANPLPVSLVGNSTILVGSALQTGSAYIGLVTVANNLTISSMISTATIYAVVNTAAASTGNVTLDDGSLTGLVAGKEYIGLATVNIGSGNTVVVGSGLSNIGFATVNLVNQPALVTGSAYIGLVTVANNLTVNAVSSAATIYAVVNTGAAVGSNTTLNPGPNYIGLVTVANNLTLSGINSAATLYAVVNTSATATSNVTLDDGSLTGLVAGSAYIGLVTVGNSLNVASTATLYAVVNTSAAVTSNVTLDDGSLTGLVAGSAYIGLVTVANNITIGNAMVTVTLGTKLDSTNDSVDLKSGATVTVGGPIASGANYIGLVTAVGSFTASIANVSLNPSAAYVGLVTATLSNQPALVAGAAYVGLVTAVNSNQPALVASSAYIGLTTSVNAASNAWIGLATTVNAASSAYIGLVTAVQSNQPALTAGAAYIGLVTSWSRNAGTTKTLNTLPVALSTTSLVTVVVPTNAQSIYITNMVLSANATTQLRIKSGVTYLTGNATIGISLNPNGGWVQPGTPDSPSWIGLPSGALVIEKNDITTLVGGHINYFQE